VLYSRPLYICGIIWLNISYNEQMLETSFERKLKDVFHSKYYSPEGLPL
jgi:hypothetical protein